MSSAATVMRLARGDFIPFLLPAWQEEEWEAVRSWRAGTRFPDAAAQLETDLAAMLGVGHVHAVGSGRVAIELALRFRGLPTGSEVVIPSFSCSALAAAVLQAGYRPVLVDVDDELNIDAGSVEQAWGPEVSAVIVPHLAGVWARGTDAIASLARDRGAFLLEDAAHALGLHFNGHSTGTWAEASIFSMGIGKPLFGPGGGLLVSQNELGLPSLPVEALELTRRRVERFLTAASPSRRDRIRRLRDALGGALRRAPVEGMQHFGFELSAIGDLDAELARLQLGRLDAIVAGRRANADRWRRLLSHLPVTVAPATGTATKVWVRAEDPRSAEALRAQLWAGGIECESLYVPLHFRAPFDRARRVELPLTERAWRSVFSLPARPNLTDADWNRIERAVAGLA